MWGLKEVLFVGLLVSQVLHSPRVWGLKVVYIGADSTLCDCHHSIDAQSHLSYTPAIKRQQFINTNVSKYQFQLLSVQFSLSETIWPSSRSISLKPAFILDLIKYSLAACSFFTLYFA